MKTSNLLFAIVCFVLLTGCKKKFTRERWDAGNSVNYTYRDEMTKDLVKNHNFKDSTYRQLIRFLGPPNQTDSASILYDIKVKYNGLHPVYAKYIQYSFNKDSIITKMEVKELKR